MNYSVLIRTFNSEKVLPIALETLRKQTFQPLEYIVVDSGSTDDTLRIVPSGTVIHRFVGSEFNYAEALNQGIKHVSTDYVVIISAHTALNKSNAIEFGLNVLKADARVGAVYFDNDKTVPLKSAYIDKAKFNGFNGLWNACSIIRVSLLRDRPFRPEVFSAEDQEWASWLICCKNMLTARISGAGMDSSANPNLLRFALNKRLNEHVAIAYFVKRSLLGAPNLCRVAFRVVKPIPRLELSERFFNLSLFFRLLACHFRSPKYSSRYFWPR